jgi:hypothetical protein
MNGCYSRIGVNSKIILLTISAFAHVKFSASSKMLKEELRLAAAE